MARKKKEEIDKELSLEEAQNVIKRLAHPKHVNQENKLLRDAAAVVLKETQPEFEFGDDEDENVDIGTASADQTTSELTKPPGFFEQIGSQAAALGPAGLIALTSAAYFQVDTVVEETRTVQAVAEEKWEEVKLEHPNINWDDPLAGFTTIIGMGDIEIDLDPPTPTAAQDSGEEAAIDDETKTETEADESETPVETEAKEEQPVEEEKEEPKKKKKGFFSKLLGGDDEEEAEEPEEESEPEPEAEAEEAKESEEESNEPEPEAEEQVEEKPKKKRGLFSFLTGGDDDKDEPESEEQGEPTQDGDTIPDEQTEEESTEEPKTETAEAEVDGGEQATQPETNANSAESNGVKKSGGGLLSLFGINTNEEEVVKQGDISADEEPVIEIAEVESETETPPISSEEQPEIQLEMPAVAEVVKEPIVEIDISNVVANAEVIVDDILIDPGIEVTAIDDVIEQVITPNEGTIIVSPAGPLYATQF
jgi:hypothetical protein